MTTIKYASIFSVRGEKNRFMLGRGKQEATVEAMRRVEGSDEHELVVFDREKVIELPEPMTPTEYADWAEANADDVLDEHIEDGEVVSE